jgi:pyruvate dehydrogenase E2 component (dihydrolipoamide acetyltransferase)
MVLEIRLPELGEDIDNGEVLRVLVKVGEQVRAGDPVLEIAHEAGTATIRAPRAGRIARLCAAPGQCMRKDILLFELE